MTSKIKITDRLASGTVNAWIGKATPAERAGYLTKGEPQCLTGNYMTDTGIVTKLHPGLRGVRAGKEVATPEEAIKVAAALRAELLKGPITEVDEDEHDLGDEAVVIAERFRDVGARMERIFHIGSMQNDPEGEPISEAIDEIVEMIKDARKRKQPLAPLLQAAGDERGETHEAAVPLVAQDLPLLNRLADLDDENASEEGLMDEFSMLASDAGAVGFLVEISVPEYRPHPDGNGASVRGGIRYLGWRYGSTYEVAANRALDWADAKIDKMWPARRGKVDA